MASKFVSGPVKVGIRPSLPFKRINLLFGNDFAGGKVVTDPNLIDKPCLDQNSDLSKWRLLICMLRVFLLQQWIELKIILMKMMKMPTILNSPIRALQHFFEIDKVDSNE